MASLVLRVWLATDEHIWSVGLSVDAIDAESGKNHGQDIWQG